MRKHLSLLAVWLVICCAVRAQEQSIPTLPDLSGIAWIDGDRFLAVHDSKNPKQNQRPRVSIIRLPTAPGSIEWKPLAVDWPQSLGPSSDLESIARIPGTGSFLLVESGERLKDRPPFRRIFLAELRGEELRIVAFRELPDWVINVEGMAVARAGNRLIFIYAERADHQPDTDILWAEFETDLVRLGAWHRIKFRPPGFTGPNWRPVSSIEVDSAGRVYAASAYDPNDDNGPFRSVIWRIGQVQQDRNGNAILGIYRKPQLLARLDGLKVEGLAIREQQGKFEMFASSDDENYGGMVRLIPIRK
jgi:hypothetical protein